MERGSRSRCRRSRQVRCRPAPRAPAPAPPRSRRAATRLLTVKTRGRAARRAEQPPHAVSTALRVDGRANDELGSLGMPGRGQAPRGSLDAGRGRSRPSSDSTIRPMRRWPSDDQVLDQAPGARDAVADDDVAVDAAAGDRSTRTNGTPKLASRRRCGVERSLTGAITMPSTRCAISSSIDVALELEVGARVAEERAVARAPRHVLGPADDQREERVRDVRDDHPERAGAVPAQAAGEPARARSRARRSRPRPGAASPADPRGCR